MSSAEKVSWLGKIYEVDLDDRVQYRFADAVREFHSIDSMLVQRIESLQWSAERALEDIEKGLNLNELGIFQSDAQMADLMAAKRQAKAAEIVSLAWVAGIEIQR
jgi:hypothetical protein